MAAGTEKEGDSFHYPGALTKGNGLPSGLRCENQPFHRQAFTQLPQPSALLWVPYTVGMTCFNILIFENRTPESIS
jgi:hypothetical protein